LAQTPPKPGVTFQTPETQALQADEAANPGMLWVETGSALWSAPAGAENRSCATCHQDATVSMRGVAARYPTVDPGRGVINLEGRIQQCRTERQSGPPLTYESNDLLALTAFVAYQSRGVARSVRSDGPAAPFIVEGKAFFDQRQGQMNLACAQCHVGLEGRNLRGDTVSQGQTHGWPAYRLEWQTMGSLHRRLRACSLAVRADVLPFGAPEYLALELYLATRGNGLPMESPGVRR
jgi:sulfur-oxidizing protein SoxA